MVRLKHANDEKSTTGGRQFHTFITLSAKKFLSAVFVSLWAVSLNTLLDSDGGGRRWWRHRYSLDYTGKIKLDTIFQNTSPLFVAKTFGFSGSL